LPDLPHESVEDVSEAIDLARLRNEYQAAGLSRNDLPEQPVELWRQWLDDAQECGIAEINAMVVSTVDPDGAPSSRTVLCKGADESGFLFFTNYLSRKGRALAGQPRVSLLFPWHQLSRQVIVDGTATPVSRAESEAYFASRPRGAQISAWASEQSAVVASRSALEQRTRELEAEYDGREVPCPAHWGGYLVRPAMIEFWQGRHDRLHDRLRYVVGDDGWTVERLCP
jgi:pyridoxamine 5'-phosphate oxidase